jgi:hypothetical protein
MNLWTMIVIISAMGIFSELYKYRVRHNAKSPKNQQDFESHQKLIARLEERVTNLETLVLEKEKLRRFDALAGE